MTDAQTVPTPGTDLPAKNPPTVDSAPEKTQVDVLTEPLDEASTVNASVDETSKAESSTTNSATVATSASSDTNQSAQVNVNGEDVEMKPVPSTATTNEESRKRDFSEAQASDDSAENVAKKIRVEGAETTDSTPITAQPGQPEKSTTDGSDPGATGEVLNKPTESQPPSMTTNPVQASTPAAAKQDVTPSVNAMLPPNPALVALSAKNAQAAAATGTPVPATVGIAPSEPASASSPVPSAPGTAVGAQAPVNAPSVNSSGTQATSSEGAGPSVQQATAPPTTNAPVIPATGSVPAVSGPPQPLQTTQGIATEGVSQIARNAQPATTNSAPTATQFSVAATAPSTNTAPSATSLPSAGPGAASLPGAGPGAASLPGAGPGAASLPSTGPGAASLPSTGPSATSLPEGAPPPAVSQETSAPTGPISGGEKPTPTGPGLSGQQSASNAGTPASAAVAKGADQRPTSAAPVATAAQVQAEQDESKPLSAFSNGASKLGGQATNTNKQNGQLVRKNSITSMLPKKQEKAIRAARKRANSARENLYTLVLDFADYESLVKMSVVSKSLKETARRHKNWKLFVMDLVETLHGHVAPINMLACAGSYLFSGSSDGKIKAWDTRSWCCEKTLNVTPLPDKKADASLTPPGAAGTKATGKGRKGSNPGRSTGAKAKNAKEKAPVVAVNPAQQAGEKVIPVMALTVHDNYLYMGLEDGRVVSRNIFGEKDMSNQMEKEVKAHNGGVRALAVSKTKVFTGGADGRVAVFSLKTLDLDKAFTKHTDIVTCLALSGNRLFSGSYDQKIHVWNVSSLKCEGTFEANKNNGHNGRINALCTHENKLYSAGWDCTIKVWDVKKLCLLESVFVNPIGICWSLAIRAPRGCPATLVCGVRDNDIEIRDLEPGRRLKVLSSQVDCRWASKLTEHKTWVKAVLPLDDGRIVTGSSDWSVKVWNFRGAPAPPKPAAKGPPQRHMIITPKLFRQLQEMRRHSPAQMLQFEIEMCANLKKYSQEEIKQIDERMDRIQQQKRQQAAAQAAARGNPPRPGSYAPGYPAQNRYPPGYRMQGVPQSVPMHGGRLARPPNMPMGHHPGMAQQQQMAMGRKPMAGRGKPKGNAKPKGRG